MKALTLWQPWASLIACGEKQYETRNWKTDYRGPLAIHASLRFTSAQKTMCWQQPFANALIRHGVEHPSHLTLGCVLCVADLVDIVRTEVVEVCEQERAFGDYTPGRFAWKLEHIRVLGENEVAVAGHQGLWDWPVAMDTLHLRRLA